MNDLNLITEFRAELAPADPVALARARDRLLTEAAMPAGAPPYRARRARPTARWGWRLAPVAGLALAVTVGLVAVGHGTPAPDVTGPTLDAHTVLQLAAAHARQQPTPTPRPDQFGYVESIVAYGGRYDPPVTKHTQLWFSVDGSRDGWLDVTSDDPARQVGPDLPPDMHAPVRTMCAEPEQDCRRPGYLPDLPTDRNRMRAYLATNSPGEGPLDQRMWARVGDLISGQYVLAPTRAALFEAAATIPGVVVVPDAVDAVGRRGVAVARTTCGFGTQLIFDATTHEYLGSRHVRADATQPATDTPGQCPPPRSDPVLSASAQLRIAIVDRARQLP